MKKAILFVDDGYLYIVFSDKMRRISLDKVEEPKNTEFIRYILDNMDAYQVKEIGPCSQLLENLVSSPSVERTEKTNIIKRVSSPAASVPSPIQPDSIFSKPPSGPSGGWLVSRSNVTVIVDDIYLGSASRNGVSFRPNLTLEPGNPLKLESLDEEQVKNSCVLRSLFRDGIVQEISYEEAMRYKREYEVRKTKESFSVHDADIICKKASEKSASDYVRDIDGEPGDIETISMNDAPLSAAERQEIAVMEEIQLLGEA